MRRLNSNGALWLLSLLLLPSLASAQDSERQILLEFYRETGGSSWDQNYGWEENTDDICDWYGVICENEGETGASRNLQADLDNPGVKELSLKQNNLSGRTPLSMWKLPKLETIYFSFNEDLDASFLGSNYAQSLKEVKMHTTATTSISGISGLKNTLEGLHMSGTHLGGVQMPNEVFELTNLVSFHMSNCGLVGTISSDLSKLTLLTTFNVLNNHLTGTIPITIASLQKLEDLSLTQNKFTGTLPSFLEGLSFLRDLFLENNQFTGTLPSFSTQANLHRVFLNYNRLTGTIPSDFLQAAAANTEVDTMRVVMNGNQLTGTVPASLDNLQSKSLKLGLSDNAFVEIAGELCDNNNWMDGNVQDYQCDAILCPVRTYNTVGHRMPDLPCNPCDTALTMGQTTCLQETDERGILTDLCIATGGPDRWYRKDDWLDDNVDICDWYGITCWDLGGDDIKNGRVRSIQLDNNGLLGTIPSSIYAIQYLEEISVSWNPVVLPFEGINIHNWLHRVNIAATDTASLKGIERANDYFKYLVADKLYSLGGTLPQEVFQVSSLKSLSMAECDLSGELDGASIAQLSNLEELYLYGNNLRGQLPDEIGSMPKMRVLSLAKNQFMGTLPVSLGNLQNLEAFSLTDQSSKGGGLSGEIYSFSDNPNLTNLMLGHNQFEGTIPVDLLSGVDTRTPLLVDFSNNDLTGTVPGSLSRFRRLDLMLENNYFVDIDDQLCDMEDWMGGNVREFRCDAILCPSSTTTATGRQMYDSMECRGCSDSTVSFMGQTQCEQREPHLTERNILMLLFDNSSGFQWSNNKNWYNQDAHICDWYGISCDDDKSIVSIMLGANGLKGHVPTQIYKLPNLARLSLFGNDLDYSFDGIENAQNLKSLILDSTGLTSLAGIEKARSLVELNVRFNRLSGTFPSGIQDLVQLESLELSDNSFSGPLPYWLGQLPNLATFMAANNKFSGLLVDFAGFEHMVYLDVSKNELTGSVPATFLFNARPKQKVFADLSNNKIGGTLPFDLERLERLSIVLKNNQIVAIDQKLCEIEGWNDYDVQAYGCDGILCPVGTYNKIGRQTSDELPCEACDKVKYMGSTTCPGSSSSAWRHLASASLVGLVATATGLLLL